MKKGYFFQRNCFLVMRNFSPLSGQKNFLMPLRNILPQVKFPHETRKYLPAFNKNDEKFPLHRGKFNLRFKKHISLPPRLQILARISVRKF
jgi:hypothetical protein